MRVADVRLLVATNADLRKRVAARTFREDLYERLGVLVVEMPALVDHMDDVPDMARVLLEQACGAADLPVPSLTTSDYDRLMAYSWPGNVRELENVMIYYAAFGQLPAWIADTVRLAHWRERLYETLLRHKGNKSAAARELGIARKTIYTEMLRRGQQGG